MAMWGFPLYTKSQGSKDYNLRHKTQFAKDQSHRSGLTAELIIESDCGYFNFELLPLHMVLFVLTRVP